VSSTPIHDSRPIEELALEYCLLQLEIKDQEPGEIRTNMIDMGWLMFRRMQSRCGAEHTQTYILQAKETLQMVGL
jgi:hypothetical protein